MAHFCPAGDGAFDDWVDVCPECGRALQDVPVDRGQLAASDAVVWLITAPNEPEAQMWANSLRAAEIQVFVRAGGPGVGAWASVSSFEHDLLVKESDLIEARRIVRELFRVPASSSPAFRGRRAAPHVNRTTRS